MPSQRSTYKEERQINLSVISMKRKGESALVRGDHYKERFLKKSRDYTKLEQELDSVKQELEQYKKKEKEKNDKESDGDYEKYIEREVKLQDITDDYLDKCFEKIHSKHSFPQQCREIKIRKQAMKLCSEISKRDLYQGGACGGRPQNKSISAAIVYHLLPEGVTMKSIHRWTGSGCPQTIKNIYYYPDNSFIFDT